MADTDQPRSRPPRVQPGVKYRGEDKVARIPIKVVPTEQVPRKPPWIRVRIPASSELTRVRNILRAHKLATVCEEASCPNLPECFGGGTATFMVMGEICTRRCPFCDVAHGRPLPLDPEEPRQLAEAIADLQLRYVVITSVDRDDLLDGGANHFASCIRETRARSSDILVEVLVPDFRGRLDPALDAFTATPPDVFNHNLETVPSLYQAVRPGSDYAWSLKLLSEYKARVPEVPTKSGLMLGLGETKDELQQVLHDLRRHEVDMVTMGQYLQPSRNHLPVTRYWHPDEFAELEDIARSLGFTHVASGPLVRSSYHADQQARGEVVR
ncbi:MAG: lipoyl synthase [Pseudomonadota bacterium]|nr:lipoyl synthase [Pseudomonadota bacterium]